MTYLDHCQLSAKYSGTIDGVAPTTVTGQVGRLAILVAWVASAWDAIQLEHITDWRWLRAEFSGSLTPGTKRYLPASFSITRHSRWITEERSLTLYETSVGVSDEGPIDFIDWQLWRRNYDRGTQEQARPTDCSISPQDELCFRDCDVAYTVRGEYMKSKQTLAANADVPECPTDFHEAIVWRTLMLLHEFDEAPQTPLVACQQNYERFMGEMCRTQLGNVGPGAGIRITAPPLA